MLAKLRPRSAYDVMAAIAFFAAVAGGSAYAAATIGSDGIKDNAVLSRHIKNGEVGKVDLHKDSVGSLKVSDNSLTGSDIDESKLGKVPLAANANTLGGHDSSEFLRTNVTAGGALTGTLPSPQLANGVVGPENLGPMPGARAAVPAAKRVKSLGAECSAPGPFKVPTGVETAVQFDTASFDNGGLHQTDYGQPDGNGDCAAQPVNARLTPPSDGIYLISAGVLWQHNATGLRSLAIHDGFGNYWAQQETNASASATTIQNVTTVAALQTNQYVEALVYQDSGGDLEAQRSPRTYLSLSWISPY